MRLAPPPAGCPCPAVRVVDTAAVVLVGNEILSGKVREANLFELARTLRALGIRLVRVTIVEDDIAAIASEIADARARCDVVFTSGGIGPTHDDVTVAAAARAFGVELTRSATMVTLLRGLYGAECGEEHLRMAQVPTGSWLASSPDSHWPVVVAHDVWLLPGIPEVFRAKLEVVRTWLRGCGPIHSRAIFCAAEETALVPLIDAVVAAHRSVEIGSYPRWDAADHRTKITFDGADAASVAAACDDLLARLPDGEPVRQE